MVKDEATLEASGRKRKRRNIGSFPCSKCHKVFTRSDHLARHYLNHQPKEVYVCNHIITDHKGDKKKCGKTFVRKDLQERHLKRHAFLQNSEVPEEGAEIHMQSAPTKDADEPSQIVKGGTRFGSNGMPNSEEILVPPQLPGQNVSAPPMPAMAFPPPPDHVPVRPLQITPGLFDSPLLYPGSPDASQPKYEQVKSYRPKMEQHFARLGQPIVHSNPMIHPEQLLVHPDQLVRQEIIPRQDNLSYYGMHSPVNNKQEYRNHGTFPQSQNDILLWLFTESPPDGPRSAEPFMLEPLRPNGHIEHEPKTPLTGEHNPTLPLSNNDSDLLRNLGLQELNFFSNSNNPLDIAVFENADLAVPHSDRSVFSLTTSTGSSNSPSTNTDSFTPATIGEGPILESDASIIAKKLDLHLKRNSPLNTLFYVDEVIVDRMIEALPQLSRESLAEVLLEKSERFSVEDKLSFCLFSYWESFNSRFSIIHRVSFDTKTCEPLLMLSMIIIGCMYYPGSNETVENYQMSPEYKLAVMIASPLRFALFQHKDFKSPVKVWVLQTLNLLEWCEKNYLPREMHERAHIHHGTTVQLLRRSPFLGGNPTVANRAVTSASDTCVEDDASDGNSDVEESSNADHDLFHKWVESESMKRVTFMTFYVDIMDYVKFRHNPQIPFYQLQLLNLPCHENQLWDSEEVNGSFRKLVKRQKRLQRSRDTRPLKNNNKIKPGMNFITAIKAIMRSQNIKDSNSKLPAFVRSILLGGLVSIMHEMQQVELQSKFTSLMGPDRTERTRNHTWKSVLTKVFDDWDMGHSSGHGLDYLWNNHKGQCSFPMYHLVQIVGFCDINHYDIAIFAGSPRNMSVEASLKDFQIVQKKLQSIWSKDCKLRTVDELINTKSVIHCYWVLWEHLLTPLNQSGELTSNYFAYAWNMGCNSLGSLYVLSVAMLVLWCNVFSVHGLESESFADFEEKILSQELRDYKKLLEYSAEDGYHYLFRIQTQFIEGLRRHGPLEGYLLHTLGKRASTVPLNAVVHRYCEILPLVELRQNISGLCFLVGTELLKSQWPIIRENAKLILNCGLRSVGKKAVQCPDLFENEFQG